MQIVLTGCEIVIPEVEVMLNELQKISLRDKEFEFLLRIKDF
jgi:hypothetical protein